MVADIYGVMSQASLQRLGPSLSAQASQRNPPASPSGNDGAGSLVSLSERAKRATAMMRTARPTTGTSSSLAWILWDVPGKVKA